MGKFKSILNRSIDTGENLQYLVSELKKRKEITNEKTKEAKLNWKGLVEQSPVQTQERTLW